jgi:hypothetical protein
MSGDSALVWGVVVGAGALAWLSSRNGEAKESHAPRSGRPPAPPLHLTFNAAAPSSISVPKDVAGPRDATKAPPTAGRPVPMSTSAPVATRPAPGLPVVEEPTTPLSPADRGIAVEGAPVYISDDVEALARIIQSEVGSGPLDERVAIAWVARNRARARGQTIARMVCQPCGKSSGRARPFSSAQKATPKSRELAALILAALPVEDPTRGATSCFEPTLQDRLHAAGRPGHELDARGVRFCWLRSQSFYGTVGRWDLFGPKDGPGARPPPKTWGLDGYQVCCPRDKRPGCRGRRGQSPLLMNSKEVAA